MEKGLKNLKRFKGNKRGGDYIFFPVNIKDYTVDDIPNLQPNEVNIKAIIRPKKWVDKNGNKKATEKRIILCKVSDLPDDSEERQLRFIFQKINDFEIKNNNTEKTKIGAITSVSDMLKKYLISAKVIREKNYQSKKKHLEFFMNQIGDIPLFEVKPKDIREAKNVLMLPNKDAKNGDFLAGKTINNYLRSLRKAFDFATKNFDDFEINPVYFVESEPQEEFQHRDLTKEEYDKLLEVIKRRTSADKNINKYCKTTSESLRDFVLFQLYIGSRKGETGALCWENIDLKNEEITFTHTMRRSEVKTADIINGEVVTTYNRNVRSKGLKASVKERSTSFAELPIIREILLRRWSERKSERVFPQDCRTAWRKCLKEAEIKNFRMHDLRKACGTALYKKEASLEEIAYYLGHKSTATTEKIYVKKDNNVSKKMGKILTGTFG